MGSSVLRSQTILHAVNQAQNPCLQIYCQARGTLESPYPIGDGQSLASPVYLISNCCLLSTEE